METVMQFLFSGFFDKQSSKGQCLFEIELHNYCIFTLHLMTECILAKYNFSFFINKIKY